MARQKEFHYNAPTKEDCQIQAEKDWSVANIENAMRELGTVYREFGGQLYPLKMGDGDVEWPKESTEINKPTKFWECEYCNSVTLLSTETMKCQGCGHPITKKAMQNAFYTDKIAELREKEEIAKANAPKWMISGPRAEDVHVDYSGPESASIFNWSMVHC